MVLRLGNDFGQWQHPNVDARVTSGFQSGRKGTSLEARFHNKIAAFIRKVYLF